MAVTKSTDTNISQRTNVYAAKQMLEHTIPVMVLDKWGDTKPMPKNSSTTIKFRRPKVLTEKTVPLVEGVTPTATKLEFEDVSATIKQYGDVMICTDVIEDTHEDPVLQEMTRMAGENIGRTREALNWGVLKAGTSVFYSGTAGSRAAVVEPITLAKQRAVTRNLKRNGGQKITKMLSSSPDYEVRAVEAAYVAVAHTDLEHDIRAIAGFTPTVEYGTGKPLCPEEIGKVEDVRYVLSRDLDPILDAGGTPGSMTNGTAVSNGGSAADIYPVLYFAQHAYGEVALRGYNSIEPTVIPVGQKTKDDPLGQRGYVGWKMWHASLILNNDYMTRLEVAATDL